MTWQRRGDLRQGDMAHGITFVMYEGDTAGRGEAAIGSRKVHLDGRASLTLALNQTRYGDELIAQVFTAAEPRVADRRAAGWNRLQIFLGPADLEAATMLERLAADIRVHLRRRP